MKDEELKEIIIRNQLITQEELDKLLREKEKLNRPLEQIILDANIINKELLYKKMAEYLQVDYVSLKYLSLEERVLKLYNEELARSTWSLPLYIKNDILHIVMDDPSDIFRIDQIQLFTNYPLEVHFAPRHEIEEKINAIYLKKEEKKDLFSEIKVKKEVGKPLSETTSVVKIVDLIISQAVRDRASDIHIEPEENICRVRFRIDGILHEIPSPPKAWEAAIISRIKVLAGMDIAESRVPQDGHFQLKVDDKIIDFRVSTLPTIHGENLVLRLLDTASVTIGLEKLGFTTDEDLRRYEELISKPYGIILSTGPTGSGKTTTLYSAITRISSPEINIITLEDPVEYRLGLIRQVQVNPKAGITFANGLRAILRQDPDVIMVGEIRDLETARMAVQAALTGHLVFSTLHTNDAASSIARLVDMGVENFLVSASLIGVMAQRLVRIICTACKEQYRPSAAIIKKWNLDENVLVYRGKGCAECKNTGYRGRTGIFELMVVDDEIKEMINQNSSTLTIRKKAQEKGMKLLSEDGKEKVLKGITTFEEVSRVCEEQVFEIKKPAQIEIKPYIKATLETSTKSSSEGKIDAKDLEEYQKRMERWLSGK